MRVEYCEFLLTSHAISGQSTPTAIVLLSAYNGHRYLADQIDSIRAQSFRDWKLTVRDDGSSDDTTAIVKGLAASDSRISLLNDSPENIGAWASFGRLLAFALQETGEYIFLADQDDVWLPDKMEEQISLLRTGETREGGRRPLLVHSDLEVVDEHLERIHKSFSEFQRMTYNADDPLSTLLIHNAIVGCTVAFNRPLLDFCVPIPPHVLHDWWLAVCASATGAVLKTAGPSVRYRQHASNVVGAASSRAFLRRMVRHPLANVPSAFRAFSVGVEQARHLLDRIQSKGIGDENARRVEDYCGAFAEHTALLARWRALRRSRARPQRATSRVIVYGLSAAYPLADYLLSRRERRRAKKR